MNKIKVRGARTHNLKNINLVIPRDKLIVITGLSGSGKSSLAFDTLYAEGQRRYFESLSTYAKQVLSLMEKPDVDYIEGLSPTISIKQKFISHNPRSTVGTITEIYDYFRLLFSRVGEPRCPNHNLPLLAQTISQMVDCVLSQSDNKRLMLLAPIIKNCKGEYNEILEHLRSQGYIRVRINRVVFDLSDLPKFELQKKYTIEVVVDRFKVRKDFKQRLTESFETALNLSGGTAMIVSMDDEKAEELMFSTKFSCSICDYSMPELEPKFFSFNNPAGACPTCNGLGTKQYFNPEVVLQNKNISLAKGAIHGWDRRNFYYFQMLNSLAEHFQFDIETPFYALDPMVQKNILFGSGKENITFKYINSRGDISIRCHPFEGILPNMERRYKETESSTVREKLSKYISNCPCTDCGGTRLRREARYVFIRDITLPEISQMTINHALSFINDIRLSKQYAKIAETLLKEIHIRLKFLVNVGLSYLSLSRSTETLSGGEAQRAHLANQIGAALVGVIYILDEPSIGLHKQDNEQLQKILIHLRDLGNTVIVVEHDEDIIRAADHIIDIGPGAGVNGGEVIAEGTTEEIITHSASITGQFLGGKQEITIPKTRIQIDPTKILRLVGANSNNLKDVTLTIPVGLFTCITGVSGSGKSTLINDTLFPVVQHKLNVATTIKASLYQDIEGVEHFNKVIDINQKPIGKTLHSNPATYTGVFKLVRNLFSRLPESRARGYTSNRFSFNAKGGRCEACRGDGIIKIEMHFLPNIYVSCDLCKSRRYNRETLEIKYKNKNIHQVLEMTFEEAYNFFITIPILSRKLKTLVDVGLSYIRLGQSSTTLSVGEAQRVKLACELSKTNNGQTLYILDEPTAGLHFADIQQLLAVLYQLRDQGNTVVVIEHDLNVIKTADWIVDLGPEGGDNGGRILVAGTPETVSTCKTSYTARFLRSVLKRTF